MVWWWNKFSQLTVWASLEWLASWTTLNRPPSMWPPESPLSVYVSRSWRSPFCCCRLGPTTFFYLVFKICSRYFKYRPPASVYFPNVFAFQLWPPQSKIALFHNHSFFSFTPNQHHSSRFEDCRQEEEAQSQSNDDVDKHTKAVELSFVCSSITFTLAQAPELTAHIYTLSLSHAH